MLAKEVNFKLHEGSQTLKQYFEMMSSYDVIDKITVPSLFYYAIDDPVIQTNSIAFDLLRKN